jgi:hypothetical protein
LKLTTVRRGEELKAAIDGGAPHVHITSHLDLTALPYSPDTEELYLQNLFEPQALQSLTACIVHVMLVEGVRP